MGYMSSVLIYISGRETVLKKLGIATLKELAPIMEKAYVDEFVIGKNDRGEDVLRLSWDYIKWYDGCDGYDDITAVMDILDKLDEDTDYTFIRLGEEHGDFENKGDLYEIYASQCIDEDLVDFKSTDSKKSRILTGMSCGNIDAYMQIECREDVSILKEFQDNKTIVTITRDVGDYDKAIKNIQQINLHETINSSKCKEYRLDEILNTIHNLTSAKDKLSNIEYSAMKVELN